MCRCGSGRLVHPRGDAGVRDRAGEDGGRRDVEALGGDAAEVVDLEGVGDGALAVDVVDALAGDAVDAERRVLREQRVRRAARALRDPQIGGAVVLVVRELRSRAGYVVDLQGTADAGRAVLIGRERGAVDLQVRETAERVERLKLRCSTDRRRLPMSGDVVGVLHVEAEERGRFARLAAERVEGQRDGVVPAMQRRAGEGDRRQVTRRS